VGSACPHQAQPPQSLVKKHPTRLLVLHAALGGGQGGQALERVGVRAVSASFGGWRGHQTAVKGLRRTGEASGPQRTAW